MELLTFHLGDREFAVDVTRVSEIISPLPITRVPGMAPALRGVIGLRGEPTGVIDAGLRLAGHPIAVSGRTPIVILSATIDGRLSSFGLLVEAAGRKIAVEQLLPWSGGLARFTGDDPCIGFADIDDQIILVLDVDKLLQMDGVAAVAQPRASRERPPPLPASPAEPLSLPSKDAAPERAAASPAGRDQPHPAPAPAAKPPPLPDAPARRPPVAPPRVAPRTRAEPTGAAAAPPDPQLDREGVYPVPPRPPPPPVQRPVAAPMEQPGRSAIGRVERSPSRAFGWLLPAGLVALLFVAAALFATLGSGRTSAPERRSQADRTRREEPPARAIDLPTSVAAPVPVLAPVPGPAPAPTPAIAPEPPPSAARTARPLPAAMVVTPDTPPCEIHMVSRGDTLWWISARKLGDPYRWPELFGENRQQLVDPNVIEVNDRIRIPGACRAER